MTMPLNAANQWRKRYLRDRSPLRPRWAHRAYFHDELPMGGPVTVTVENPHGEDGMHYFILDVHAGGMSCWHDAKDARGIVREVQRCRSDLSGKPAKTIRVRRR